LRTALSRFQEEADLGLDPSLTRVSSHFTNLGNNEARRIPSLRVNFAGI
jgi:hypothetical protein